MNLEKIDALLITHTHSDHVAGLDDLRVFYWPEQKKLPVYATKKHGEDIKDRVPYLFQSMPASPSYFIPPLSLNEIKAGEQLKIGDIEVDILYQDHGETFSLGFIFDYICGYSTDLKKMPEINFKKLSRIPLWIVESLREKEHQAHAHFDLTFSWIERINPGQAVLTHLGNEADYQNLLKRCPENTMPGHDGMIFTFDR